MSTSTKILEKIPVLNQVISFFKKVKFASFEGLSLYDVLHMYGVGVIKGAISMRASAISYSFFMALFPFLLFVLNLIPYVPLEGAQEDFIANITVLLPAEMADFIEGIFTDIAAKKRAGLLSTTFVLSIFLMANGVSAIFGGFENSYHAKTNRSFIPQYLYALGVALILALLFFVLVVGLAYFEFYVIQYLSDMAEKKVGIDHLKADEFGIKISRALFFMIIVYLGTSILFYFGTSEGKNTRFFSPGAWLTTILFIVTTYFFGFYIDNFSKYNELYGAIGGLLILLLYIWLNSNILLLGFELNASIRSLQPKKSYINTIQDDIIKTESHDTQEQE